LEEATKLSESVFHSFMQSPVMRARLSVLDLEIWDSSQFFECLTSISGTDEVDIHSFVTGCMQLRGYAKRLSMQAIHTDVRELAEMVKSAHIHSTAMEKKILQGQAEQGERSRSIEKTRYKVILPGR